jgi:hypothetical protein
MRLPKQNIAQNSRGLIIRGYNILTHDGTGVSSELFC